MILKDKYTCKLLLKKNCVVDGSINPGIVSKFRSQYYVNLS